MTLDTRVYVLDHVELRDLFTKCQELLAQFDEQHRGPHEQRWRLKDDWLMNEGMQGLPAWLIISHHGERPYRTAEQAAVHDACNHPDSPDAKYYEPGDPVCTKAEHDPVCWYEVSFDTAYGYRGPDGMNCGDLHARLVSGLGQWLDEYNVGWKWQNEFSGEIHGGDDRYERLVDLCSGGFEATAWFRTTVMPAIAAHIASEGGAS